MRCLLILLATAALGLGLNMPAAAEAQNSIGLAGGTLTVTADPDGATVEYRASQFLCFPPPCATTPDYDISSPQTFASIPPGCTDNGANEADLDCTLPTVTRINGSNAGDTIGGRCFLLALSRLEAVANGGDDEVSSTCGNSSLDLGPGNDVGTLSSSGSIAGGDGNDVLDGGSGINPLTGGAGKDTLLGGAANDTLDGGDGNDTLDGQAGNDVLLGSLRRDLLIGGANADTLQGGDDTDTVSYEDKVGALPVEISANGLPGDDGETGEADTIAADVENVIGSIGADTITGNAAANDIDALDNGDVINPGGGPDFVDAGPGNDRVEALDGVPDRIECGSGNDLAVVDAFDSVTNCETVQASRELMPDIDADGVLAPADCDDRNAGRRPGNVDQPGNGIDEDCSGADAPYLRILSPIQSTFTAFPRFTRVNRLRVLAVPEGGRVEVRCLGGKRRGCFKGVKRFSAPRRGGDRDVLRSVRRRKLRPKAVIEVRVLDADSIGKVVRFTVRKRKLPKSRTLCLVPGRRTPGRCPRT